MERLVSDLLQDFENGKMTRRQLVRMLAAAVTAAAADTASTSVEAAGPFKTEGLDHISYEVADYRRSRDFYAGLMGMSVSGDDGHECQLRFGDATLVVRNKPAGSRARIDHLAYRIADWNTAAVRDELVRRKLNPRADTGANLGLQNYASFHVDDPDGFDLQISGRVK